MLIVKPILDKKIQKELGDICNAEYNADYLAFSAYEEDRFIGYCQFSVSGNVATLIDIRSIPDLNDFEAMFIMSRGALNYMELCGFKTARCTASAGDLVLIRSIGFRKKDDIWYEMDLTTEFTDKCSNCN